MSDLTASGPATENPADKGKGKAPAPEDESESSEEDQTEVEEDGEGEVGEEDLSAIDPSNIIGSGRRTRGKLIDFAKAAAEQPADVEDEEDDDYTPVVEPEASPDDMDVD